MKRFLIPLFVLLFQGSVFYAQNGNEYKYVRVPESFDFLKEENQYQLNALTAFLFEKYGYEALYEEPLPEGVSGCDVLHADVENNSGLFRTRLVVLLKNCADDIVFTSEEGVSREKDYKTAYHAALREAFQSLDTVQLVSSRLKADGSADTTQPTVARETVEIRTKEFGEKVYEDNSVPGDAAEYTNGRMRYRLKKTSSGYELFKEGQDEKFASLVWSAAGNHLIYTSQQIHGTAQFDAEQNLLVEYLDEDSGQILNLRYDRMN